MPSPFPGMNPFLEHPDVWSTFHTGMLAAMADRLSAQVRPDYLVHMEAHLWIHERADDHEDGGLSRRLIGRSDVSISKSRAATSGGFIGSEAETAVLTPAMRILIPLVDIERQRYLEIRDRRNRELVAVVELLSPVNKKSGPYRAVLDQAVRDPGFSGAPGRDRLAARRTRHARSGAPLQHVRGDGQSRRGAACSRLLADRASTALAHDSGATTAGQFPCLSRAPKVAARGLRQGNLRPGNLRTGDRASARSSGP